MTYFRFLTEIVILRNAMLGHPAQFKNIIAPSSQEAHKSAAFLVCCHATIESFIEWRAMEVASTHLDKYRSNGLISPCIVSLLQYSGLEMKRPPQTLTKKQTYSTIDPDLTRRELINRCYKQYVDGLDDNNGIKTKNLHKILIPLGVDMAKLDNQWLHDMDSY